VGAAFDLEAHDRQVLIVRALAANPATIIFRRISSSWMMDPRTGRGRVTDD
jgi:hypothetical protein